MKIATFTHGGRTRLGILSDTDLIDLAEVEPECPTDMTAFLAAGEPALALARKALATGGATLPLDEVRIEPVVPRPGKFMALGMNYAAHIAELGRKPPEFQTWFNKQTSCVNGAYDPVHVPRESETLDYEAELGFVIGRRCRRVPRNRAHEVIAGFCVINDVSLREWQWRVPTFTLGKSWDTHGPMGPWLVTPDEIPDPHALGIRTWVNGELRQDSSTADMVFRIDEMIEHLSTAFTLEPGDVFATGTPAGVAAGFEPPRWLAAGDVVRVEIEGVGRLENRIIDEPADTAFID